ncbi:hypothetical protein BZG04_15875, partial [Salinivibrio kushneri]|uniref:EpsG family protein n=1 Tax=Salinivibrio kushneri TaxID=1908198 RepID=UPI0009C88E68
MIDKSIACVVMKKIIFLSMVFVAVYVVFQFFYFFIFQEIENVFGTDQKYYIWLVGLSKVDFFSYSNFISQIIENTYYSIRAPEPIAHFVGYISTLLLGNSPKIILDVYELLIVFLLCFSLSFKRADIKVQLFLLFLMSVSYYWFVLFEITHRLKIAILFVICSFFLANRNKEKAAMFFLVLSVFCHFSILLSLPVIYILNRERLVTPIRSLRFFLMTMLFFLVVFFALFLSAEPDGIFKLTAIIKDKLSYLYSYSFHVIGLL